MAHGGTISCTSTGSAADFLPSRLSLPVLAKAAQKCRGCDLYCHATQAVFGEGPVAAHVMLVGEQPGDQEDLAGHPFVGPAGRLLDETLDAAGIPRKEVYVTNAVKHFKWTPRGKRRLHSKPTMREVSACRPWLEAELQIVHPPVLVLMGSTAAQSLLGSQFRVTKHRGEIMETEWAKWTLATVHPSSLLRIPDQSARREAREQFLKDFRLVAKYLKKATAV